VLYVNINVKTFIGGAVCRSVRIGGADGRRNVTPCRMQQRTVQFFGCALKVVMVAELFVTGDHTSKTA